MPAFVQRACHYCFGRATTKDHVVPRFLVRELGHLVNTEGMFMLNQVPSCDLCNQLKGSSRGWCFCAMCVRAWDLYLVLKDLAGRAIPA